MKRTLQIFALIVTVFVFHALPSRAATGDAGPLFGELELVDEILVGTDTTHPFAESGEGHSEIQTLLGTETRVIPNEGGPRYFAYRIGEGKGLVAGQAYVLEIDYPEDAPRTVFVRNKGAETTRGFATGTTFGDTATGYAVTSLESMNHPLSGETKSYRQLFWLHDRFQDIAGGARPNTPDDGFWVIIAQPGAWQGNASNPRQAPLSAGAAVSSIRLYAVPDPSVYNVAINYPPGDLPRRHIFFREEMSDEVVHSRDELKRGVTNDIDWYEYKAKLMAFLGMNTFSKDLLEFGANQGWDSTPYGSNTWVHQTAFPDRWSDIIDMLSDYDHSVLPYYEYCGSKGDNGLGYQIRARPLWRDGYTDGSVPCQGYTHIWWTERCNADITDPDTYEDFRKMLELTIVNHKDSVNFAGAWLRTRVSSLPISFSDETLQRYSDGALGGADIRRDDLQNNPDQYAAYRDWWNLQRQEFLTKIQGYLAGELNQKPVVLFSAYTQEGGPYVGGGVVTDDVSRIEAIGRTGQDINAFLAAETYLDNLLLDPGNWDDGACSDPDKQRYEWQHSVPRPDPQNYTSVSGALMTYPFNYQFTTKSKSALDAFRTPSGLAMIRHYTLNENTMSVNNESLISYFVSDVDRAGDASMLGEAQALAFGDPNYLGYLAASSFTRGFPAATRDFNAAFLALPAVPSQIWSDAASDDDVIVRAYETADHGTFLAIVNTAMTPKNDVVITLPADFAATNRVKMEPMTVVDNTLTVNLNVSGVLAVQLLPVEGGENEENGEQGCACSAANPSALRIFWLGIILPIFLGRRYVSFKS